jgi:hypothetical protein
MDSLQGAGIFSPVPDYFVLEFFWFRFLKWRSKSIFGTLGPHGFWGIDKEAGDRWVSLIVLPRSFLFRFGGKGRLRPNEAAEENGRRKRRNPSSSRIVMK